MNVAVPPGAPIPFDPNPAYERVRDWALHYQRAANAPVRRWRRIRRQGACALHTARELTYRVAKRAFDFTFAAMLLAISSPSLLLIAVAIKLTDRGPVLYWQKRVGVWGQVFAFPKFRSMVVGADRMVETLIDQNHHGESITFKMKRDPRVTWIGRLIRRFSLDEFPQLWCVLRGQMSVVGPRPALPREVNNYTPAHRRRLAVRPGLTCIWQVSGRADVPFEGQVQMDVEYVESHNFWLDLKLVASTVPAIPPAVERIERVPHYDDKMTNGVAILGVPIDSVRMEQALQRIEEYVLERSFHQIATANVDFLAGAAINPEYREILLRCDLVLADGMPLVLASRLLGHALLERVTGSDLVPRLAALSRRKGYGIFLLGAQPDVCAAAALHMEDMGARIVGKLSPSVGTLDATADEEILDAIEKANPDILLVALGSPKQEIWIDRNRDRLKVPVCVGIGGALDFISGKIGRAPIWMQRACLEWCYRLWQEPRRLAPRYLKDALFMARYFSVQLAVSALKPRSGQALRMAVDSIGPVNILSASGMMTGPRLAQLEHAALRVAEKSEALVINLTGVSYLGADGIRTLARLHTATKRNRFWLAGPRPALVRTLRASCCEELTQLVVPSVLDAVRQASPGCLQPRLELAADVERMANDARITALRKPRSTADVAA